MTLEEVRHSLFETTPSAPPNSTWRRVPTRWPGPRSVTELLSCSVMLTSWGQCSAYMSTASLAVRAKTAYPDPPAPASCCTAPQGGCGLAIYVRPPSAEASCQTSSATIRTQHAPPPPAAKRAARQPAGRAARPTDQPGNAASSRGCPERPRPPPLAVKNPPAADETSSSSKPSGRGGTTKILAELVKLSS